MNVWKIALPIVFAAAGVLVGVVYFWVMRRSLTGFGTRKAVVARILGFGLLRLALFGAGAFGALKAGAWSLIAYALGFFAARTVIVRRARAEGVVPLSESEGEEKDG